MQESIQEIPNGRGVFIDHFLLDNPTRYHDIGSPYLGLAVPDQAKLAKFRRPKGRTPKGILYQIRKATKEDYRQIVLACSQALIFGADDLVDVRLDRISVDLKLMFNFRKYFPKTFPRGVPVAYGDWWVVMRYKVDYLLKWLYDEGHSPYTPRSLRKELWALTQEVERMEFVHTYGAPISVVELYSDLISEAESGIIVSRKDKGRKRKYRKKIDKPVEVCNNDISEIQLGESK